ncbi:MAG: hypothetical protein OEL87_02445, partial [Nanoarchaeota archaeon]|nr:hypothetical protein [Nanoarchaeota archaeon]
MAHEKYIKKNGKVFGPYLYENYRENGRTKTRYIGKGKNKKSWVNLKEGVFSFVKKYKFLLIFTLLFFIIASQLMFTGNVSLDIKDNYASGEKISGFLNLSLEPGEFLPADTIVKVGDKEFLLGDLILEEPEYGDFKIADKDISGSGEGYGTAEYPTTLFTMVISSIEEKPPVESLVAESTPEEPAAKESAPEEPVEEKPIESITGQAVRTIASSYDSVLTGLAVSREEISGEVVYGSPFIYNLIGKQKAEIVSSDEKVKVKMNDGQVIVTTDYIGEPKFFSLDLSKLNIEAEEGELVIDLIYENQKIASASKKISVSAVGLNGVGNETPSDETPSDETPSDETPSDETPIDEKNITEPSNKKISNGNGKATKDKGDKEKATAKKALFEITLNETNVTLVNETIINETVINVTNISTLQYRAVIGRPVKWIKAVNVSDEDLTLKLPKKSKNISILTNGEITEALKKIKEYDNTVRKANRKDIVNGVLLTGNVALDIREGKGLLTRFWNWITSFRITGNVVLEEDIIESVVETNDSVVVNVSDIINISEVSSVAVEYYTEAPVANETDWKNGKRVVVSAPSDLNYTEILSYTLIEGKIAMNDSRLRLYWYEDKEADVSFGNGSLLSSDNASSQGKRLSRGGNISEDEDLDYVVEDLLENGSSLSKVQVSYVPYDFDGDGYMDYAEWVVPHLSAQLYEFIYIVKAEHLDENRTLISDIYDDVRSLDGNWSEVINDSEYVRVTFEVPLDNSRDVTFYGRSANGSSASVEIYEVNGTELLATFSPRDDPAGPENVSSEGWYKVYLTELNGTQDVFDLKINCLNLTDECGVEFDYIVDPTTVSVKINSSDGTNTTSGNLQGYCNATDAEGDDLVYDYKWYNGSVVYIEGTLFKEGSIAAGSYHTCGIRASDSRVLCWGRDLFGQLGDGTTGNDQNSPTLTSDTAPYIALSAGAYYTCGIRANDSRVLCWGYDLYGQLGDGTTGNDQNSPTLTSDSSAYTSVITGISHACGIRASDSRVLCWGYDA